MFKKHKQKKIGEIVLSIKVDGMDIPFDKELGLFVMPENLRRKKGLLKNRGSDKK